MLNSYYTNAIAKIAEKFVSRYFNDFYDDYTDANKFGCVHGRAITHALLKSCMNCLLLLIVHKTLLWTPAQRKRASMLYFANVYFIYLFFMAALFSGPG